MFQGFQSFQEYRNEWNNAYFKTPYIPLNLDVELSAVCNLKCPFCFTQNSNFKKIKKVSFMPIEFAKQIINIAAVLHIPALKFNWRGESTLHPFFAEIVRYASQFNFYEIIVNTNGNCLEKSLEGLKYVTKVIVSIDSIDPITYKEMRVKGDLAQAINTVNYLIKIGHRNIHVRRVKTEQNKDESYYHLAKTLWGDKIKVSEHICFDRNKYDYKGYDKMKRIYCGYPSQRLIISTNGDIFPCCVDYYETMPLGNISKDDLLNVWNSNKLNSIRRNLKNNDVKNFPKQCRNCTSWMSYDVFERNFLVQKKL